MHRAGRGTWGQAWPWGSLHPLPRPLVGLSNQAITIMPWGPLGTLRLFCQIHMGNKEGMNLQEVLTFSTGEGLVPRAPLQALALSYSPIHLAQAFSAMCFLPHVVPLALALLSSTHICLCSFSSVLLYQSLLQPNLALGSQAWSPLHHSSSRHWSPCSQCPRRSATAGDAQTIQPALELITVTGRQEALWLQGHRWRALDQFPISTTFYPSCHTWPGAMS